MCESRFKVITIIVIRYDYKMGALWRKRRRVKGKGDYDGE
jgi:hypothetical protein